MEELKAYEQYCEYCGEIINLKTDEYFVCIDDTIIHQKCLHDYLYENPFI
jgi:hypothetical protein